MKYSNNYAAKPRRHLKRWIQSLMSIVTIVMFIAALSVDSFDIKELPKAIGAYAVVIANLLIIRKYGKGRMNEIQL